MANHLSMANSQAIAALHRSGRFNRPIARVLGINRETVGMYVNALQIQLNPPTGSDSSAVPTALRAKSEPISSWELFRHQIILWFEARLSIKRITNIWPASTVVQAPITASGEWSPNVSASRRCNLGGWI